MSEYIRNFPLDVKYRKRLVNPSVKARPNEHTIRAWDYQVSRHLIILNIDFGQKYGALMISIDTIKTE